MFLLCIRIITWMVLIILKLYKMKKRLDYLHVICPFIM